MTCITLLNDVGLQKKKKNSGPVQGGAGVNKVSVHRTSVAIPLESNNGLMRVRYEYESPYTTF